ncbi:hypothetical protein JHK86_001469 [Glycine max]|nr:hypothetical protein JHK86_001469 [Glycine max]
MDIAIRLRITLVSLKKHFSTCVIFTHHVAPNIKEVDSEFEATDDPDALALEVYDPPPSSEYVSRIELELLRTRKAFAQALDDRRYAEDQAVKWQHLIVDFFYKKLVVGKLQEVLPLLEVQCVPFLVPIDLSSDSDSFGEEFFRKLDEDFATAKQKGEPSIVEAAALHKAIVTRNPKAMVCLYIFCTGVWSIFNWATLFCHPCPSSISWWEETAVSISLPLAKRSVLGGLLPKSLLYVLERSGPAAFAAAMVSDSDTPEIIWTHKMRAENLIRQHLSDFPHKLSQHCHVLYDYALMPPVTYPKLRDEMWYHCYYLRNLCDDIRFPNWPIVEHVEFLQSLLVIWREEFTRKPMNFLRKKLAKSLKYSFALMNQDTGSIVFPCPLA